MKIYESIKHFFRKYRNSEESNIDYENAKTILKNVQHAILVDVRSPQEYKEGHLDGSINYPLYDLERNAEKLLKDKENTIIIYCQSGSRSQRAIKLLQELGYSNLFQIEGGLDNMK